MSYLDSLPLAARPYLKKLLDEDHEGVDKDLNEIASHMVEWQEFNADLGLTEIEISNIKHKYRDSLPLQRREALRIWKNKNGLGATYGRLLKLFEDGGHSECAKATCDVLVKKIK